MTIFRRQRKGHPQNGTAQPDLVLNTPAKPPSLEQHRDSNHDDEHYKQNRNREADPHPRAESPQLDLHAAGLERLYLGTPVRSRVTQDDCHAATSGEAEES